jgi:hypothetical protein
VCDGAGRPLGTLSGALPGETVTFWSPQLGDLLSGQADAAGTVALHWQCDPGEAGSAWTVVATGGSSGATAQFTVEGAGPAGAAPAPAAPAEPPSCSAADWWVPDSTLTTRALPSTAEHLDRMVVRVEFTWTDQQLTNLRCDVNGRGAEGYEHEVRFDPATPLPEWPGTPPAIETDHVDMAENLETNLPSGDWYKDVDTDLWEVTLGLYDLDDLQAGTTYYFQYETYYTSAGAMVHGVRTQQADRCPLERSKWCMGGLQGDGIPFEAIHQNALPRRMGGIQASDYRSDNYSVALSG